MGAVLDPNVLVSAAISTAGPPREILMAWVDGRFELLASLTLLAELREVLARVEVPPLDQHRRRRRVHDGLSESTVIVAGPPAPPRVSPDPDDDYLIALGHAGKADYLVSGDGDLVGLADPAPPVLTPRKLLDVIKASDR